MPYVYVPSSSYGHGVNDPGNIFGWTQRRFNDPRTAPPSPEQVSARMKEASDRAAKKKAAAEKNAQREYERRAQSRPSREDVEDTSGPLARPKAPKEPRRVAPPAPAKAPDRSYESVEDIRTRQPGISKMVEDRELQDRIAKEAYRVAHMGQGQARKMNTGAGWTEFSPALLSEMLAKNAVPETPIMYGGTPVSPSKKYGLFIDSYYGPRPVDEGRAPGSVRSVAELHEDDANRLREAEMEDMHRMSREEFARKIGPAADLIYGDPNAERDMQAGEKFRQAASDELQKILGERVSRASELQRQAEDVGKSISADERALALQLDPFARTVNRISGVETPALPNVQRTVGQTGEFVEQANKFTGENAAKTMAQMEDEAYRRAVKKTSGTDVTGPSPFRTTREDFIRRGGGDVEKIKPGTLDRLFPPEPTISATFAESAGTPEVAGPHGPYRPRFAQRPARPPTATERAQKDVLSAIYRGPQASDAANQINFAQAMNPSAAAYPTAVQVEPQFSPSRFEPLAQEGFGNQVGWGPRIHTGKDQSFMDYIRRYFPESMNDPNSMYYFPGRY